MSGLLAIEMSTGHGSIALLDRDGGIRCEERFEAVRGQGSRLFPVLESLARESAGIGRILVGLGPGSYAGLRVAIAAAAGFGRGLGLPLVGLPSVLGVEGEAFRYVGDARRGALHYARVDGGRIVEGPELVDPEALRARLAAESPGVPIFGPAPIPGFPELEIRFPDAVTLARAALRLGEAAWTLAPLEPLYLREASVTRPGGG